MRRVGIVRIGGVAGVGAAIVGLVAVLLELVSETIGLEGAALLNEVAGDKLFIVSVWLYVAALALSVPAVLALSWVVRYVGGIVWVPVALYPVGIVLALVASSIRLAVAYELAERFVESSPAAAEPILAIALTVGSIGAVLTSMAVVLAISLAIGILSLAVLFVADLPPRWLGWTGLAAALLGLAAVVPPLTPWVLEALGLVLVVWFAGLGGWLVRLREPLEAQ